MGSTPDRELTLTEQAALTTLAGGREAVSFGLRADVAVAAATAFELLDQGLAELQQGHLHATERGPASGTALQLAVRELDRHDGFELDGFLLSLARAGVRDAALADLEQRGLIRGDHRPWWKGGSTQYTATVPAPTDRRISALLAITGCQRTRTLPPSGTGTAVFEAAGRVVLRVLSTLDAGLLSTPSMGVATGGTG